MPTEIEELRARLEEAAEALGEFIRIDGFISMHEMFERDWEPAVERAREVHAKLKGATNAE